MDRTEVHRGIVADPPEPGELVYLARTGTEYTWCVVCDPTQPPHATPGVASPDAWIYYAWAPAVDVDTFLADLLAELESMAGGADRCRWPVDGPWPHGP